MEAGECIALLAFQEFVEVVVELGDVAVLVDVVVAVVDVADYDYAVSWISAVAAAAAAGCWILMASCRHCPNLENHRTLRMRSSSWSVDRLGPLMKQKEKKKLFSSYPFRLGWSEKAVKGVIAMIVINLE